jgi:hypothetical protein
VNKKHVISKSQKLIFFFFFKDLQFLLSVLLLIELVDFQVY